MNIAVIFAGGTGQRMNSKTKPKQFLKLHGKPILIYTVEQFQIHEQIDAIIIVCIENWISYCQKLVEDFGLDKVVDIIPGGYNGQNSIFQGIQRAYSLYEKDSIVLIHDGVRPLVDEETISKNITSVKEYGSAITTVPAIETIVQNDDAGKIVSITERKYCKLAKAPQSFYLADIYKAHCQANSDGKTGFIDSASLMHYYKYELHMVDGKSENIKITTPADFYTFRALLDAKENSQIFGL